MESIKQTRLKVCRRIARDIIGAAGLPTPCYIIAAGPVLSGVKRMPLLRCKKCLFDRAWMAVSQDNSLYTIK
ncbi:MAG: hypothetical protein WBD99_13325 [Thermodesulfobacteriota bacterium]